jgi:antitoxin ParD1/3/4
MNVSLTPELDKFAAGKVESGRYTSASEVIREAPRLLEEHGPARSAQGAAFNREVEGRPGLVGPWRVRGAGNGAEEAGAIVR